MLLETERLTLRQFTPDDVENLVEFDADPEVMRYITGGRATLREEIERRELPAFLAYYTRSDGHGFWAAVEKATGEFVGWFHLAPTRRWGRRRAQGRAHVPCGLAGEDRRRRGDVEYALTRPEWEARQK